jgi:hypothetical protein
LNGDVKFVKSPLICLCFSTINPQTAFFYFPLTIAV